MEGCGWRDPNGLFYLGVEGADNLNLPVFKPGRLRDRTDLAIGAMDVQESKGSSKGRLTS